MSKLSEIVFKPVQSKEFDVMGKKVLLRSLNTRDTIELDLEVKEEFKTNELLEFGVKILSRAVVSIDGVTPDNPAETKAFLESQESSVVFEILAKYQELTTVGKEELKN